MKRVFLIVIFAILVTQVWGQNLEEELWTKAAKLSESSWNFVPGTDITVTKVMNKKNEVINSTFIEVTHSLRDDGSIRNHIEKIIIDAEDKTENKRDDKQYKNLASENVLPENKSLFHNNPDVKYSLLREMELVDQYNCHVFEYEYYEAQDGVDTKMFGKVYIDENGIPRYRYMRMDPQPKKVKELETKIFYKITENGNFLYVSNVEINIYIKFLIINNFVKTSKTYSNYWRYEIN